MSSRLIQNQQYSQLFWDLAEPELAKRKKAAVGIVRTLNRKNIDQATEIEYALTRLVRGTTSNRLCSRQGFSLALTELLKGVDINPEKFMDVFKEATSVTPSMPPREKGDRFMGRLFSAMAMNQAGLFKTPEKWLMDTKMIEALHEVSRLIWEVFDESVPLREAAAKTILQLYQSNPSADKKYFFALRIEKQMSKVVKRSTPGAEAGDMSIDMIGFALMMRYCDERVEDLLSDSERKRTLHMIFRQFHAASMLHHKPHFVWRAALRSLLLQNSVDQGALGEVLGAMDAAMFKEEEGDKSSMKDKLLGLRCVLEALSFVAARARVGLKINGLLPFVFESCPKAIVFLISALQGPKHPVHKSAIHILERFRDVFQGEGRSGQANKSTWGVVGDEMMNTSVAVDLVPTIPVEKPVSISDSERIAVFKKLYTASSQFKEMTRAAVKCFEKVLIEPLGMDAMKEYVAWLFDLLQGSFRDRNFVLDQLSLIWDHPNITDDTVLGILCFLFQNGHFAIRKTTSSAGYNLKAGLDTASDMFVPMLTPLEGEAEHDVLLRGLCQNKFWSVMSSLTKRMSPDRARASKTLHTKAFDGMLNDGTFWLARLHAWFTHITTTKPTEGKLTKCKLDTEIIRERSVEVAEKLRAFAAKAEDQQVVRGCHSVVNLLLGLSLMLVRRSASQEEETEDAAVELEHLTLLINLLAPKKKLKPVGPELFQQVVELLPTFCLNPTVLIRDVARGAWLKCSNFITEEVIDALLEAIDGETAGAAKEGESDEESEDEAEQSEAEEKAEPESEDEKPKISVQINDDKNDQVLQGQSLMDLLLEDDDGSAQAFAKKDLEKKKQEDQERLQTQNHQLRTVDLLEVYLGRSDAKSSSSDLRIVGRLWKIYESTRKQEEKKEKGQRKAGDKLKKKAMRNQGDLQNRLEHVLQTYAKVLKDAQVDGDKVKELAEVVMKSCSKLSHCEVGVSLLTACFKKDAGLSWSQEVMSQALNSWLIERGNYDPEFFRAFTAKNPALFLKANWGTLLRSARTVFLQREALMIYLTLLRDPSYLDNSPEEFLGLAFDVTTEFLTKRNSGEVKFESAAKNKDHLRQLLQGLWALLHLCRTWFDVVGRDIIMAKKDAVIAAMEPTLVNHKSGAIYQVIVSIKKEVTKLTNLQAMSMKDLEGCDQKKSFGKKKSSAQRKKLREQKRKELATPAPEAPAAKKIRTH